MPGARRGARPHLLEPQPIEPRPGAQVEVPAAAEVEVQQPDEGAMRRTPAPA
jgi:hypothetical protein